MLGFSSKCIHSGKSGLKRSLIPSIVTSTNYELSGIEANSGYQYISYQSPTRDNLEESLAVLDNAKYALTFSSGVGALSAIVATLKTGDRIVTTQNLYGGTIRLFNEFVRKSGIELTFVDFDDLESVQKGLTSNTKLVHVESPTNPLMEIFDIKAIADVVHDNSEAVFVVDNTFLTSYFQRPLELGADIAMYSLTKFYNGHSDVMMGSIATNNEDIYQKVRHYHISTGMAPSPFDCSMVSRSLKTLPLRMEKHSENAFAVAKFLEAHPKIQKVFHPWLKSHEKHEIALKQSYGHSGILSFYLKGTLAESENFFNSLSLILVAQSLGGVETTASFPWTMSHADMTESQRLEVGVTETLIRLSVGLEDIEEIIEDLRHALK